MASSVVLRSIVANFKTSGIKNVPIAKCSQKNWHGLDFAQAGGCQNRLVRFVSTGQPIRSNGDDDNKDLPLEKDPSKSPYSVGSANILGSGPMANRIMSYSSTGFVVGNQRTKGPVVLLPKSISPWAVKDHTEISIESLEILTKHTPSVEIVVIGTGDRLEFVNPAVVKYLRDSGIAVEIQGSTHACATYNFLAEEGRHAAAALIPPPSGKKK
eukprot:m.936594 g.936594  ORF g.936594 m.936594 type:complete len:213 (-) comp23810_c1_seq12:236-874(-)